MVDHPFAVKLPAGTRSKSPMASRKAVSHTSIRVPFFLQEPGKPHHRKHVEGAIAPQSVRQRGSDRLRRIRVENHAIGVLGLSTVVNGKLRVIEVRCDRRDLPWTFRTMNNLRR